MANHWNNTHAIWHDLSVAQGRAVPAQIEHPVALDERPPPLAFPEETEEQFYKDYIGCSGEGSEYNSGPDIALIQKMLQEMKQPSEEECTETNTPKTCITITKKPVKQKNLAIASLIEMRDNPSSENLPNGLFTAQPSLSHAASPGFHSVEMFKKKKKKSLECRTSDNSPTSVKSDTEPEQPRVFVPSSRAAEFYHKYAQHALAEERARETVWTRAQKEMMEIDQKRKLSAMSPGGDSSSSETSGHGTDLVLLSRPRHTFTDAEDCIVCRVMSKMMDTHVKTEPK